MDIADMLTITDREIDAALAEAGNDPALLALPRDKLRELFLLQFAHHMQDIACAMIEKPEQLNG